MTDIVARLQLRADQFSSENFRAFAEFKQRAASSAQEVRGSINAAMSDVSRITERALAKGVTKQGGLDLSGEIAQLKEAALASDRRAIANRQLEEGYQRIALAEGVATEKQMQNADAAKVAALSAERNSAAIRQEILAYEQLQIELDQIAGAQGKGLIVARQVSAANDNQRNSAIMLGQQLQDFSVQVVSGQSVALAFAQQIGQASFALQGMGGKLAGVANFLGTWTGIIGTTALVVLAPFVAKILDSNDALGDQIDKLKKDAIETENTARAKDIFARSAEGLAAAIREERDALDGAIKAEQDAAARAVVLAEAKLKQELATRRATQAALEDRKVALQSLEQPGVASERGIGIAQQAAREQIADLQRQIASQNIAIATAERNLADRRINLETEIGKRNADPVARINYDLDREIRLKREAARASQALAASLDREITAIQGRREAALKALRDQETAASRSARDNRQTGRQIDLAEARRIVGSIGGVVTSGLRTIEEQKVLYDRYRAGKGPLAAKPGSSDHERGLAVDIRKGAGITLAGIREAFRKEGVALTQLLDEGAHFHAAFGRKGAAGDVVSARAAELKEEKRQAAEAKRANEELERSLDQLANRYDPLRAAARAYVDELDDIAKLSASGKIGQVEALGLQLGARQRMVDARSATFNDQARAILGPDVIAAGAAELDRSVENWREGLIDGAQSAGDKLRLAVSDAAGLFGIRASGPLSMLLQRGGVEGQAGDASRSIIDTLKGTGIKLSQDTLDRLEGKLSSVLAGAAYGQMGGSVFASITGGKQSPIASALGGVVGNVVGKELGGSLLKSVAPGLLKNVLGGAAGPLGAIAGGVIGNVLGGLFKPAAKYGTATVGSGSASGNDKAAKGAASGLAGGVSSGLDRIAEQLGGTIGSYLVSVGTYNGMYRVSTSGQSGSLDFGRKNKQKSTLYNFDGDQQAAMEFAIRDAISDGAIRGISAAAQNILRSGKSLETAITKAVLIESVPRDLKAALDPVGAAVDELNRKFQKTVDALKEGGASAEQMAQAEQLYNLQLQQVKGSTAAASASLKDFLTDLKLGSASPYSLRDQQATAMAQLKPYLDAIDAGQRVDQDKYQAAARLYLDVERQLNGSTSAFFDAQAMIQAATTKAIATIDNAVPITTAVESPFAKATASSAAATASNTATGNELLAQLSQQMQGVQALLGAIAGGGGGSFGGGSFIGDLRAFADMR